MKMKHVNSSNLSAVGYDSFSRTLHISFHSGGTYAYYGVPETIYLGLMSAASHGKYFNAFIRNRYGDTEL